MTKSILIITAPFVTALTLCVGSASAQMTLTGRINPPLPVEECTLIGDEFDITHDFTTGHASEPLYHGYHWPNEAQLDLVVSSCPTGGAAGSDDCLRLKPLLRRAAQRRDGLQILIDAAIEHYRSGGADLRYSSHIARSPSAVRADAFADLAVTGRSAYDSFARAAPNLELMRGLVRTRIRFLDAGHRIDNRTLDAAINASLTRAYAVAWMLRGPIEEREARRMDLGWIAVSAEDDPPHRPVNVPTSPHPQDDILVRTPSASGALIDITTRYMAATIDGEPSWTFHDLSGPPLERPPEIGLTGPILIYLHGLGSKAEEAGDIIRTPRPEGLIPMRFGLLELARRDNKRVTVISLDMPTRGYATHIDHTDVAPPAASAWNTGYPWLDFNEEFVVRFVRAMEARYPGFKRRLVGVMGGSLGGNLTLRLSERSLTDTEVAEWARRNAAWSAAAVWPSFGPACITVDCRGRGNRSFYDHAKHEAVRISRDKYNHAENDPAKRHFLYDVIKGVDSIDRGLIGSMGSNRWYRNSWQPCKFIFRNRARRDLNEVYSPEYRQWHFRGAHEQLIFSHQDAEGSEVENPANPRFHSLNGYLLFVAGSEDDHIPEFLARNTELIARRLNDDLSPPNVEGEMIILRNTGHSIHNERPGLLAALIKEHLLDPEWEAMDMAAAMSAATTASMISP